jgi:phosphoglycolate phosphatase-like HAD superfamily hydrolase
MRLLLFDIDGTLIHSNRAGRAALTLALQEIFGTAGPVDAYLMAGKTDPLIISELMQAAGIPSSEVEARLANVYECMAERGEMLFPQKGITPCTGVRALLRALSSHDEIMLGLVTGNIERAAPLKLAAAGIDPGQFQVGAYGSDAKDRNRLPALAMERASALVGYPVNGSGALAVAVASGSHRAVTLAQYNPDHLLHDLRDTDTVLRLLLNGSRENHG